MPFTRETHDARAIANVLLKKAWNDYTSPTPLQIIKMVYFCQAWMLAIYNRPLILDSQPVEAWRYGPVIRDVYDALKIFGNRPIHKLIPKWATVPFTYYHASLDDEQSHIVNEVFGKYGRLSGTSLTALTHQPGTPWSQVHEPGRNKIIHNEIMKDYYGKFLEQ